MKKTLLGSVPALIWVFFIVPVVHAQFTPADAVLSQGSLQTPSTAFVNVSGNDFSAEYDVILGFGLTGTTTSVVLSAAADFNTTPLSQHPFVARIYAFTDATRATFVSYCQYEAANDTGTATFTQPFTQLAVQSTSGSGSPCVFSPSLYYLLVLTFNYDSTQLNDFTYYGAPSAFSSFQVASTSGYITTSSPTAPDFVPMFSVIGNGFSLYTPTASSTGSDTLATQAYCNTTFATSSGFLDEVGSSISNGFCQVFTTLLVPSQNSLQQFSLIPNVVESKIPVSYFFDVLGIFNSLSASSSQNIPDYSINLQSIGIGSTTALGDILPASTDLLSSSTIGKYLPSGVHDTLYALAEAAIWLAVAYALYEQVHKPFKQS